MEKLRRDLKQLTDEVNKLEKQNEDLRQQLKKLGENSPPLHTQLQPTEPPEPPANSESGMEGGTLKKNPSGEQQGPGFFPPDIVDWMIQLFGNSQQQSCPPPQSSPMAK